MMAKVMHIVGNRPQFIKLAPVSRELNKRNIDEIIIHTGQHYDKNMSDVFFEELGIPNPDKNLNIGSGSHAEMTAKAMTAIEQVVLEYRPACVIVYGDTNSTLAAALVVSKLNIPLIHVEAGPRTYSTTNPEEKNRIVVDHLSDVLCAPDVVSKHNLLKEGILSEKIFLTGDVMYDEFLFCMSYDMNEYIAKFPKDYILMTWHRQENTETKERIQSILDFLKKIHYPIILPLHPRTKKAIYSMDMEEELKSISHIKVIEPVGYLEMVALMKHSRIILTDSGGASKEASFAKKKSIFMLDRCGWTQLVERKYIQILDFDDLESVEKSLNLLNESECIEMEPTELFGTGNAAKYIVDNVEKYVMGTE